LHAEFSTLSTKADVSGWCISAKVGKTRGKRRYAHVATVMDIALTRHIGHNVSDGAKFICIFFVALAVMIPMDLFAYVMSI